MLVGYEVKNRLIVFGTKVTKSALKEQFSEKTRRRKVMKSVCWPSKFPGTEPAISVQLIPMPTIKSDHETVQHSSRTIYSRRVPLNVLPSSSQFSKRPLFSTNCLHISSFSHFVYMSSTSTTLNIQHLAHIDHFV
jgi:hypothetical protein